MVASQQKEVFITDIRYFLTILSRFGKKVVVPDLHNGGPTAYKEKSVFVKTTKEIKERLSKEYGFTVS